MTFDYQGAKNAGYTDEQIGAYMRIKGTKPSQGSPSVGGFIGNIGKSAVENVGGIGSAIANTLNPDMEKNTIANLGKLAVGTGQLLIPGEQGLEDRPRAVGQFYKDRYGGLENIKKTAYEDPVGLALDASVVLGGAGAGLKGLGAISKSSKLAKAGQIASKVSKFVDPLSASGKGLDRVANKIPGASIVKGGISKAGRNLEKFGKEYALRGLRPSQSMQNKFRQATGMNIEDYIQKKGLYGNDIEMAKSNVEKYQTPFDELTLKKDVDVPIKDILDNYDREISLLNKKSVHDPVAGLQSSQLLKQRQKIIDTYYQKVPNKRGSYALKPKVKSETLENIVMARKGIDKNTPKGDFGQSIADAGSQRKIGDIYRDLQYKYGGKKVEKLGKELKQAYSFKDVLEKAPKGKGTLPLNLTRGVAGIMFNNPVTGAIAEAVINSPRTVEMISKGTQNLGKTMQKTRLPNMPKSMKNANNIFKKILEAAKYERMINPK